MRDSGSQANAGRFHASSFFYQSVRTAPRHPRSQATTNWLTQAGGFGLGRMQIDFSIMVLSTQDAPYARRTNDPEVDFYTPDCDDVPFPIPAIGALEGEENYACTTRGDCHLLVYDLRLRRLFESYATNYVNGRLTSSCIASWDMTRAYTETLRGEQCTSADAAGFPIAPLLFSAEEVASGHIDHAIRFILPNERMRRGYYVHPATHAGSPAADAVDAPVYGSRFRLRADFPLASLPNDAARTVARAMQEYGLVLADGGNVALTAQSDRYGATTWTSTGLAARDLAMIVPNDLEVIDTGAAIELTYDCQRTPY